MDFYNVFVKFFFLVYGLRVVLVISYRSILVGSRGRNVRYVKWDYVIAYSKRGDWI